MRFTGKGGGGLRTLFLLVEFAQLGKLSMVSAALAQGAGYGIQLFPVLQDINQLREIYGKDEAHTFLGMSGATFAFTPNDPETAEWMSKRSGEISEPGLSAKRRSADRRARKLARANGGASIRRTISTTFRNFTGWCWFAGQSAAQPVYAPPYWDKRDNADLAAATIPIPITRRGGAASAHGGARPDGALSIFGPFPASAQQSVALPWPLVRFPKVPGMSVSPLGVSRTSGVNLRDFRRRGHYRDRCPQRVAAALWVRCRAAGRRI